MIRDSRLDRARHHRLSPRHGGRSRLRRASPPTSTRFGALTGCDTATWDGYLDAHRVRRAFFKAFGATSTDHGHPTARTEDLPQAEAAALFAKARAGKATPEEADAFRGQMLTEMARMSLEDGLVLQIHPGSLRNHSARGARARIGRDKGFDIPTRTDFVRALKPLLDAVGMRPELTVILFMLDETDAVARTGAAGRASIRRCGSGRPGGSTTARRACAASAS